MHMDDQKWVIAARRFSEGYCQPSIMIINVLQVSFYSSFYRKLFLDFGIGGFLYIFLSFILSYILVISHGMFNSASSTY